MKMRQAIFACLLGAAVTSVATQGFYFKIICEIDRPEVIAQRGWKKWGLQSLPLLFLAGTLPVRLSDGVSASQGRLEVQWNNEWGTVCNTEFSAQSADVICRELGFMGGFPLSPASVPPANTSTSIYLSKLSCTGQEGSIDTCSMGTLGDSSGCDHSADVGVICALSTATITGGSQYNTGLVEVQVGSGPLGTLCDVDGTFSDVEASVVCQQVRHDIVIVQLLY